jgi:hypothetical protein
MTVPASREPAVSDHLVAFVDLLGFAALIESSDEVARQKIAGLLKKLASLRGDFAFRSDKKTEGTTTYIEPAVSSFSDCIVVSFDLAKLDDHDTGLYIAWQLLGRWFGEIGLDALQMGCLLRGGVTIGPLFHENGVVFGSGLVRAYRMESESARYPRIIVSQSVIGRTQGFAAYHETLFQADDGEWCLDYLMAAYRTLSDAVIPMALVERRKAKRDWAEKTLGLLVAEGVKHRPGTRAFQNWRWMQNRLLASLGNLSPYEFSEDGSVIRFQI